MMRSDLVLSHTSWRWSRWGCRRARRGCWRWCRWCWWRSGWSSSSKAPTSHCDPLRTGARKDESPMWDWYRLHQDLAQPGLFFFSSLPDRPREWCSTRSRPWWWTGWRWWRWWRYRTVWGSLEKLNDVLCSLVSSKFHLSSLRSSPAAPKMKIPDKITAMTTLWKIQQIFSPRYIIFIILKCLRALHGLYWEIHLAYSIIL